MMYRARSITLFSSLLALSLTVHLSGAMVLNAWADNLEDYTGYVQQANGAIEHNDLSGAAKLLEKAMPLAPDVSIPVVQNNLAAVYMKRGNLYHNVQKQDALALNDFRKALFLLDYGWPEGVERKPLHQSNLKIAKDNLRIAYGNMKINPSDKSLHLKMAKDLRLEGKFQEAIVEYAQVADGDPANLESLKALGDLFNVLNKPDKSKKYYSKAVKAMGGQVKDDVLVQLANAQNKSGEVNAAIENLNKALEINPTNPTALQLLEGIWKTEIKYNPASVLAHANLAGVYQKLRRFEDALSQYNAAEHFANLDPQTSFDVKKLIRLNMGTLFQELKRYEQALQAYDTVLQAEPKHLLATYYKATLYKEAGQPEEAQRWYYRVLSIDPNNENVHRDLLEMVTKQSDPQKVIAGLKGYGDQVPQNALVQYKVGEELHKLKDFDDAALYYQKAIDLKPDMAAAYANLGAVLQTQGKDEESLAAFKKAVELDPNNETVKKIAKETQEVAGYKDFQKAIELQQAGNIAEALPYFKKALAASPNNPDYIADYGIALQNTSDLAGAIAQYQKALTLQPGNANYHYYLGTAYHQNKELSQALQSYKKAVELDKGQTDAQKAIDAIEQSETADNLNKALESYNQKKYTQALGIIQQVLKVDPNNATAYYYKGMVLNEQKQVEGAIQSYREAIRKNPDFGDAYYALGLLLDTKKDKLGAKNAFQKFIELSKGNDDDFTKYAKQRVQSL